MKQDGRRWRNPNANVGSPFEFDRIGISAEDRVMLRNALEKLWNGDVEALGFLRYIFHTFDRWKEIYFWLFRNKIVGRRIVEYFQNESAHKDGRGMLEPCRRILARIDGDKGRQIRTDDLKGKK